MSSLTDRYLAATLRAVPTPRREEIATELRGSIEDMIEGRTGAGQDAATAEREVLNELGNPDRLAARYADRRLQLIGPTYYLHWQRLLRLLLSFVPALVGTLVGLARAAAGDGPTTAITSGFTTAFDVAIQIAFWVTLVFAIVERVDPSLKLPAWTVDQLPEVPAKRDMTLTDIAASVALLLFTAAFLPWQHFWSWVKDTDGERIPLLDPVLWRSWLPVLIAVLLAGVAFELVRYRVGRWTWPLVTVKAALDLAFSVPVVWLLVDDRLLNPALVERFAWLQDEGNRQSITVIAIITAVVVLVWDLIDSGVKARRAG
ncbi:permease prefix domain 1-containing protein [Micromonospora sp. NBC_01655]|uniref:permease prefix domain 1-containing protein n=1 Tax=Micromonospora sp. NBC_01655 TaxID=2975983 RepID=UPI0022591631|nr:permease prefix domain 1-containing protein [Micromonospora sp. NBC_01655]MCX4473241.1 permease prefix domain 1-containing protein [Micromonospora sp. NBC_01655]